MMKRGVSRFFQAVIVVIGIAAFTFLLWEPTVEGRNIHSTFFEIYFTDPFLAYAYTASIPFFVALYHGFTLFGYAARNELFSQHSIKALRTIRYCAVAIVGFVVVGVIWILLGETDDRPPVLGMGVFATCVSVAIVVATAKYEKRL